jgi:hypothetical protein
MSHHPSTPRKLTVLVDVDGTLAIRIDRDPFDWDRASEDFLNEPVATLVRSLLAFGLEIVFVSGRPESARSITEDWLRKHLGVDGELHLRPDLDFRQDAIVKREIFEAQIQPHHEVVFVLDDRDQVVKMWREELGLTCLQVSYGDF